MAGCRTRCCSRSSPRVAPAPWSIGRRASPFGATMTADAPALRLPRLADPADLVWVFDLDNTLYPASCNLFKQVDARMASFIAAELSITETEARALQKRFYRTYGTTLRGLMLEHAMPA